ncbi:hypothetical protein CCUG63695_02132 [Mycobacteroides franklinii]|uniref:Uncharacterized protein n=1 Tax=Mycobacteroides franklinii TaxID=948102 RepID=A0A4V3HVI4_9MYCO|nr:hypothetical protein BST24_03895 [Mycobacteroides franklinii]TDZ42165.1 hypothetical protein CCUG64054_02205 [Mycobacteroides franklinii]TDZ52313.1 hypothetical protein CCUG63697_00790 [Mycobacteroides franklinii]TDZ55720.1 hypothetical protein CCUG63696_02207 [Mycobacteroides franklinii]TDZ62661.1 hypothetical protein CCUG63695_02132 [Mycobacteroides franklinii]
MVRNRIQSTAFSAGFLTQEFLRSEYVDHTYAGWPIDQRLEGFLRHHEIARTAYDGDIHTMLLERVMAYIGKSSRHELGSLG